MVLSVKHKNTVSGHTEEGVQCTVPVVLSVKHENAVRVIHKKGAVHSPFGVICKTQGCSHGYKEEGVK